MKKLLILACLALTNPFALGCAALDGGGGAGDTSSAPTSRLDNLAAAAVNAGGGLQAAAAAVAPANPMIGAGLSAVGTALAAVGGLVLRRRLVWGTVKNRRTKRRAGDVWSEQQRAAVRATLAANAGDVGAAFQNYFELRGQAADAAAGVLSPRQQGLDSPATSSASRIGPRLRAAA